MTNLNQVILIFLNDCASSSITIQKIAYIFADLPIFFLPIFLVVSWVIQRKYNSKKSDLLFITYGTIIGIILAFIIQQFVNIDRPENYISSAGNFILAHIPDASFPSDHAVVSFAFLVGLFFSGYKKIAYIYLPFVIIMNISRIAAGVHWPFDILAGALIGILSAYISFRILKKQKSIQCLNEFLLKISGWIKL